jgi:hypothetical protein
MAHPLNLHLSGMLYPLNLHLSPPKPSPIHSGNLITWGLHDAKYI